MALALRLHPDSRCEAVRRIEVALAWAGPGVLTLAYEVTGTIGDIALPPVTAPLRADDLWRATCFEAFLGPAEASGYFEFNFAPSTQWAAYRFEAYREGVSAPELPAPRIEPRAAPGLYELRVTLDLSALPAEPFWRLGLSAVVEEANGNKSYWALAHPPGKPDFHHADAFAHHLAPGTHP